MKKILYIGTWHHIQPVIDFPDTKHFIFIDTQPRSEWDNDTFYYNFYKPHFTIQLINMCNSHGFKLINTININKTYHTKILNKLQWLYYLFNPLPEYINPTLLIFSNSKTNQIIKYFISTNIELNMDENIKHHITTSDALIVSGYLPNKLLFKYFEKPKIFIGYTNTHYKIDKNDDQNTIMNPNEWSTYFSSIIKVDKKTGEKTTLTQLSELF
jgi:hypothetical protein